MIVNSGRSQYESTRPYHVPYATINLQGWDKKEIHEKDETELRLPQHVTNTLQSTIESQHVTDTLQSTNMESHHVTDTIHSTKIESHTSQIHNNVVTVEEQCLVQSVKELSFLC